MTRGQSALRIPLLKSQYAARSSVEGRGVQEADACCLGQVLIDAANKSTSEVKLRIPLLKSEYAARSTSEGRGVQKAEACCIGQVLIHAVRALARDCRLDCVALFG